MTEPDPKPEFDADLPHAHPQNKAAAAAHGLRWDGGGYIDEDGCLIRDRFGQPY